ncbi:hypothetical protein Tco_0179997 [Tanacetum coccineum]
MILGRPSLGGSDLYDVYEGEITLRNDDQSLTLKCGDAPSISYNNLESLKKVDLIDVTCEEYSQEVLGFSIRCLQLSFLRTSIPIVSTSSPTSYSFDERWTFSFRGTSHTYDPLPHKQGDYYPGIQKDLKSCVNKESSERNSEVSLKRYPPHLECGMTVVTNEENELVPYKICPRDGEFAFDYRKLAESNFRLCFREFRSFLIYEQEFVYTDHSALKFLFNQNTKAYWALKHANFDLKTAGDHRKLQLNELSELRDQAYENSLIYKEKTKKLHDSKIKNRIFNVGDQVLLFNSRLKIFSGKLKSRWSGPFTITEVYPYGTAKLSHADGSNFKVNCHRLKHYYGGDTPPLVIPDLQTFPKDN